MFNFFRRKRAKKYAENALVYIGLKYVSPAQSSGIRFSLSEDTTVNQNSNMDKSSDSTIKYSIRDNDIRYSDREKCDSHGEADTPSEDIRYSRREKPNQADTYNAYEVTRQLHNYSTVGDFNEMLRTLEESVNPTFVERLLHHIKQKDVRDSEVYKAAQVDKRLFSKIVSNREYKPSKDTAIALSLSLELSLEEANDMLSRAGYTLSHSNKRDIVIEFFFREKIYNLIDVNDVLHRLNQKPIGRV